MSGGYFGFTPGGTQQFNAATGVYSATAGAGQAYGTAAFASAAPASATFLTGPAAPPFAYPNASQATSKASHYGSGGTFVAPSTAGGAKTSSLSGSFVRPTAAASSARGGSAGTSRGGGTSTYSGYDAAVYAAATSYLQAKSTPGGGGTSGGNNWLGLKRSSTGRGSFPMKRGGGRPPGMGMQQLHYCDVCKISCAGPQTYREHLEGQRHKKKEAQAKSGETTPLAKSKVSFRCDLCDVTCTGQDTYNAHVRGIKHQKTLKLHHTLGKPIPNSEPVILPPSQPSSVNAAGNKVIGVARTAFVAGQKLSSTAIGPAEMSSGVAHTQAQQTAAAAALAAEQNLQPVGEDYVEPIKDHTGKLVQYYCKLCDCKFNDLNAKDMHLKGRRHRLQFKKKVNPDLEVDLKPVGNPMYRNKPQQRNEEKLRKELLRLRQQELWSMRAMYTNQMMPTPMMGANSGPPQPLFGGPGGGVRPAGVRGESSDDRHVLRKHAAIYPSEDELTSVQKLVMTAEKALKGASDHFAEQTKAAGDAPKSDDDKDDEPERLLKGVMRVGLLAKGLLLRAETDVSVVVLCSQPPTKTVLTQIAELLPEQLAKLTDDKFDVQPKPEAAAIVLATTTDPKATVTILLSSVLMRDAADQADEPSKMPEPSDLLDKQKCLEALAELRHAKWFQARCSNLQSCLLVLRVMRDICQRIPTWAPLSNWALQLFVEKVLTSAGTPLSAGDALRRVFEAAACGVLLPTGPGLLDPCEKEVVDAARSLTPQQREDITSSAQHALRLIAFSQLYKILAIERLDSKRGERKRPRDAVEEAEPNDGTGKKDKRDQQGAAVSS